MFACRAAWRRYGPLARRIAFKLHWDGLQQRQMSSMPGGTGENIVYAVLCGGTLVAAVSYTLNTVSTDSARYNDRISEINARPKTEWTPQPFPPKRAKEEPVEEASEELVPKASADMVLTASAVMKITEVEEEIVSAEIVHEAAVKDEDEGTALSPVEAIMTVEKASTQTETLLVVEEVQTTVEPTLSVEKVITLLEVDENSIHTEVIPAAEESRTPDEFTLTSEESSTPMEVVPAVEELLVMPGSVIEETLRHVAIEKALVFTEAAPLVEETPTLMSMGQTFKEDPLQMKAVPVVEEPFASIQPLPTIQDVLAPNENAQVVEEAPNTADCEPVLQEYLPPVDLTPAIKELPTAPTIVQVSPVVEEMTLPFEAERAVEAVPSAEVPSVGLATLVVEEAPSSVGEAPDKDFKQEYIVVVLEGTLMADKSPKVLGVAPISERIIPAPDDEDKRHLLRIQMQ